VAMWAYLKPVLDHLRSSYPSVKTVHMFSDGPTTQYRQKKTSFFFQHDCLNLVLQLVHGIFLRLLTGRGQPMGWMQY